MSLCLQPEKSEEVDLDGAPLDVDGIPIDEEDMDPELLRRRREREQRHKDRDRRY